MNFESINKLMADASKYLYEVKGLRPTTVDQTIRQWRYLRQYMEDNSITSFSRDVGQGCLKYAYCGKSKSPNGKIQIFSNGSKVYSKIASEYYRRLFTIDFERCCTINCIK